MTTATVHLFHHYRPPPCHSLPPLLSSPPRQGIAAAGSRCRRGEPGANGSAECDRGPIDGEHIRVRCLPHAGPHLLFCQPSSHSSSQKTEDRRQKKEGRQKTEERQKTSVFRLLSSLFCLSSVFCLLSSIFFLLSSVFCLLSSFFIFLLSSFFFLLSSFQNKYSSLSGYQGGLHSNL